MSAESMLFNGAILAIVLTLIGMSWGFLLLKIQGGEETEQTDNIRP